MDNTMMLAVLGIYAACFIGFTLGVGAALRSKGKVFLAHTFQAQPQVADAVHFLLNLGFYLACTALLLLNVSAKTYVSNGYPLWIDAAQTIASRLGGSIFVVVVFHTANILILSVLNRAQRGDGA